MFEPVQRRIQRALIYAQDVVRKLANPLRDGPPVHGLETQNLQNQEVERALKKFGGFGHMLPSIIDRRISKVITFPQEDIGALPSDALIRVVWRPCFKKCSLEGAGGSVIVTSFFKSASYSWPPFGI